MSYMVFFEIGVTLNDYQVQRGNQLNKEAGLQTGKLGTGNALSVKADFMKLPFPDNHFDGVYAIEATCHAPRREGVYSEIYRTLKPGQIFACYEWYKAVWLPKLVYIPLTLYSPFFPGV